MTDFTGASWQKATASNNDGNCVEVARVGGRVGVRDSKDRRGPVLEFTATEWSAFTGALRGGEPARVM